jgi:hypothetical protein
VRARRVAPSAVVAGKAVVWRAEVGGRDGDGARQARPPGVVAAQLVAGPARRAVVEQRRAQRRRVRAVPVAVQVAVPASAACICVASSTRSDKTNLLIRRWNPPSSAATDAGAATILTHCAGSVAAAVERGVRALPPAGRGLRGEEAEGRREEEEESAGAGCHCYSQAGAGCPKQATS